MKVNQKTFDGGYKFENFEGQPSKVIQSFDSSAEVADLALKAEDIRSAKDVLDGMQLTGFEGPESSLMPTDGTISPEQVKHIVISGVEVEAYDFPNEVLLSGELIQTFKSGLNAIHEDYTKAKITLLFDESQTSLSGNVANEVGDLPWLDYASIVTKYPANMKELNIPLVLGMKYPVGYAPAHIGLLYLSISDVVQVGKFVEKKALETSLVALSGIGWKENLIIEVAVGTKIKEIESKYMGDGAYRCIENSLITGTKLADDAVVTYATKVLIAIHEDDSRQSLFFLRGGKNADSVSNTFISRFLSKAVKRADTNLHGERRACISCTYCQKVCPVDLIPHLLHKHVDKQIINKRLVEYKIFDCIECGLCDYVCPSKIEVSSNIKKGKDMLEKAEFSHNKYVTPKCEMIRKPMEVAADE